MNFIGSRTELLLVERSGVVVGVVYNILTLQASVLQLDVNVQLL